eukprot:scaffold260047_cov37-Tisochrysis_lutea.AAC.2
MLVTAPPRAPLLQIYHEKRRTESNSPPLRARTCDHIAQRGCAVYREFLRPQARLLEGISLRSASSARAFRKRRTSRTVCCSSLSRSACRPRLWQLRRIKSRINEALEPQHRTPSAPITARRFSMSDGRDLANAKSIRWLSTVHSTCEVGPPAEDLLQSAESIDADVKGNRRSSLRSLSSTAVRDSPASAPEWSRASTLFLPCGCARWSGRSVMGMWPLPQEALAPRGTLIATSKAERWLEVLLPQLGAPGNLTSVVSRSPSSSSMSARLRHHSAGRLKRAPQPNAGSRASRPPALTASLCVCAPRTSSMAVPSPNRPPHTSAARSSARASPP